jgi:hypothetical protein
MSSSSFSFAVGRFVFSCVPDGLPHGYETLKDRARLVDEFHIRESGLSTLVVSHVDDGPLLVVCQSCPSAGAGFYPSALFVEETNVLFYGAGERILAYTLDPLARVWEDAAECGLWGWSRHGNIVVMSAELELAAFSLTAQKLWTTFVEPPWTYRVEGDEIEVDVMGKVRRFSLSHGSGPPYR